METTYYIKRDFKNSSDRDCSWDYMNGVVEHYDGYYCEEDYEDEALLIDIHVKNTNLRSELIYMHDIYTDYLDILDFILAVEKMEYCQKHDFNGVILMDSRVAMDWLIAGRIKCSFTESRDMYDVLLSVDVAIDWLDSNGCNYQLAIDLGEEYGIYNPWTGRGMRVSKLDVGFVEKKC